jgi:glycosyltransferase involved in cell wall biosynthesis
MPCLTVITCAYNAEKTLKRTIDSVLNQTFTDFEYIVIDHGSTDGTREIITECAAEDKRVTGVYADINVMPDGAFRHIISAASTATGKWIVAVDADDEYKPDAFERMLAFADKHSLDCVCCGSDFVNADTDEIMGTRGLSARLL